jgi:hypothetical protein
MGGWNKHVLEAVFTNGTPKQCLPLQKIIPLALECILSRWQEGC